MEWFAVFWLCIILRPESLNTRLQLSMKQANFININTFLLLSQLFYQCYGINTAIDILYEYKWSLLFFTRRGGVNDVFWAGRLDSVFSVSLLHREKHKPNGQTVTFVLTLNLEQEVRPLRLSLENAEAESGRRC